MTPDSDIQSPLIRHQPFGEQHPYLPLPYERSPRNPCAGEKVTLGVETGKNPPASSVWCDWHSDGNSAVNRVKATLRTGDEACDQWQIELPAFQPYQAVHYRIFAEHAGHYAESEEFSFSVAAWENVTQVTACKITVNQLELKLATTHPVLSLQFQTGFSPEGTVSLTFTAHHQIGVNPPEPAANGPIVADFYDLRLSYHNDPFRIEIIRASDGMQLRSTGAFQVLVSADGTVLKYRFGFASPSDEAFYGFGERFNALDQRGNRLDNYVFHQYTGQGKRTYIPVPFFISSRGYGLWLPTQRQAEFDLAASQVDRWALTGAAEDEQASLDVKLFFQPDPHAIIQAFTDLVGKPKLPPAWAFGLWMSSNDWNDQAEVLRQLRKTQEENIPVTVLVIEAWSDEINFYIWNDAQYPLIPSSQAYRLGDFAFPPQGRWPDPKAMADEIHRAAISFILNTRSKLAILTQEDLFGEKNQLNLPGTVSNYPNWSGKMRFSLEEFSPDFGDVGMLSTFHYLSSVIIFSALNTDTPI